MKQKLLILAGFTLAVLALAFFGQRQIANAYVPPGYQIQVVHNAEIEPYMSHGSATTNTSIGVAASAAFTGIPSGSWVCFSCTASLGGAGVLIQYRTGTGTPTAVQTDREFNFALFPEKCMQLSANETAIAYFSSAGALCKTSILNAPPL